MLQVGLFPGTIILSHRSIRQLLQIYLPYTVLSITYTLATDLVCYFLHFMLRKKCTLACCFPFQLHIQVAETLNLGKWVNMTVWRVVFLMWHAMWVAHNYWISCIISH